MGYRALNSSSNVDGMDTFPAVISPLAGSHVVDSSL